MRAVVQQVALLLVSVGVILEAGGAVADTEDCDALTKRLPTAELDKVFGDWVLVWSVADGKNTEVLKNTSSSHLEVRLLSDNHTIHFYERNAHGSNIPSCVSYIFNLTVQQDSENLTLHTTEIEMEVDGVLKNYNESGELEFYFSSSNSLQIFYKGEKELFLLSYKREGLHRDVDEHKTSHDFLKKHAECLKFSTEDAFIYDGVSDFCHKKSSVEEKAEES